MDKHHIAIELEVRGIEVFFFSLKAFSFCSPVAANDRIYGILPEDKTCPLSVLPLSIEHVLVRTSTTPQVFVSNDT